MTPPLPAIPPQPTQAAITGGNWASSGNGQISPDANGALPYAEYAEYRQWLDIAYHRNPKTMAGHPHLSYRDLVQFSAVDIKDVRSTMLHTTVTVHTSCKFISANYAASSYHQPQKFVMLPQSQDKEGYSYGDVNGSGVVFGPRGHIQTLRPYISRRPIVTSGPNTDVEYSRTDIGTNYVYRYGNCGHLGYTWRDGADLDHPYSFYMDNEYDVSPDTQSFLSQITGHDSQHGSFAMTGPYNVSAEPGYLDTSAGNQQLITTIESVVASLTDSNSYWNRFAITLPTVSSLIGDTFTIPIVEADRLTVNPYYSSSFHDYS